MRRWIVVGVGSRCEHILYACALSVIVLNLSRAFLIFSKQVCFSDGLCLEGSELKQAQCRFGSLVVNGHLLQTCCLWCGYVSRQKTTHCHDHQLEGGLWIHIDIQRRNRVDQSCSAILLFDLIIPQHDVLITVLLRHVFCWMPSLSFDSSFLSGCLSL